MNQHFHTHIIKIGNSKGVRIPKEYLSGLGDKITIEQTEEGILIRPMSDVPPLEDWPELFAKVADGADDNLSEWDTTLEDGVE